MAALEKPDTQQAYHPQHFTMKGEENDAFIKVHIIPTKEINIEKEQLTSRSDYLLFCKWQMPEAMFYNLVKQGN